MEILLTLVGFGVAFVVAMVLGSLIASYSSIRSASKHYAYVSTAQWYRLPGGGIISEPYRKHDKACWAKHTRNKNIIALPDGEIISKGGWFRNNPWGRYWWQNTAM